MQNCSNSGKPFNWQSRAKPQRESTTEGVETRRAAPNPQLAVVRWRDSPDSKRPYGRRRKP